MNKMRYWIFIRGLARSSEHWGPFVDQFKKTFPEDHIELIDLAGNGSRSNEPSFLSIEENVTDLINRSRTVKETEQYHIMSISLGSMVAAEWARQYPQNVASITMINTSEKGSSHFFERMHPRNYLSVLRGVLGSPSALEFETEISRLTTTRGPQAYIEWIEKFSRVPRTTGRNIIRQLWAASKYQLKDKKPIEKVLIFNSLGDRLVNPICSQNIANKWKDALFFSHPSAGHDLPLEEPEWLSSLVKQNLP